MSDQERKGTLELVPEIKATAILSIRDSMRQRGLSLEEAADLAGLHADELREIVEARQVQHVSVSALDRILEALAAPGRQP